MSGGSINQEDWRSKDYDTQCSSKLEKEKRSREQIKGYETINQLGKGTFASVYQM